MASKSGDKKSGDKKSGDKKGGDRLPFEPTSSRKKASKQEKGETRESVTSVKSQTFAPQSPQSDIRRKGAEAKRQLTTSKAKGARTRQSSAQSSRGRTQDNAIPEEVSRRMIKRMAVLCGVPTLLGLSTFVMSYFIVINEWIELPPIAVLLVSLGFFGIGVLGLSYGALSTSWDEGPDEGSLLGLDEFKVNVGRMRQAWKESKEAKEAKS